MIESLRYLRGGIPFRDFFHEDPSGITWRQLILSINDVPKLFSFHLKKPLLLAAVWIKMFFVRSSPSFTSSILNRFFNLPTFLILILVVCPSSTVYISILILSLSPNVEANILSHYFPPITFLISFTLSLGSSVDHSSYYLFSFIIRRSAYVFIYLSIYKFIH